MLRYNTNDPRPRIRSLEINVICYGEPKQTLLNGQGILMLHEQCGIQIPELQITSMFKIITHINRNINLTEYLFEKNATRNHFLRWNSTSIFTAEIEQLQQRMAQLPELQTYEKLVTTNHSVNGCLCLIVVCLIGFWLFKYVIKQRCKMHR